MSAFTYLAARTTRNWVRIQLGRFKRVRYVLALIASGLYFWVIFFRNVRFGEGGGYGSIPETVTLAAIFIAIPIAGFWLVRANPQALAFSDAERQHLFPAPITRRSLILYKLARGQLMVLLNVAIFSVVLTREATAGAMTQRALGLWALFTILYLHRLGAALTRLAGRRKSTRIVLTVAPPLLIGSALTAIAFSIQQAMPRLTAADRIDDVVVIIMEVLQGGAAGAVLAPFRLLLSPVFPRDIVSWAGAMGVVLLILLAHLAWVLLADVAFEDAAASAGRTAASRAAGVAEGRAPSRARLRIPRLPLRSVGRPEVAIIWKNTVPFLDGIGIGILLAIALLVGFVASAIANSLPGVLTPGLLVMVGALVGAAAATFMAPFMFRHDLRNDLPRLALLRTYPIRGVNLVWAEVLSVAVPIAVIQLMLLAIAFVTSLSQPLVPGSVGTRVALLIALAMVLPCIALTGVMVQNAAALLFPDWVRLGPAGTGSLEATGQAMLLFGATLIMITLLLLLPLAGAGLLGLLARGIGSFSMVPAAGAASVLLLVQIAAIVRWLGTRFDRTDPVEAGVER